ncbi:MAG: AraC family transcriptional regulator [Acutalibacteraceae bacterium]|nr:AraC family transcriptional regulator [Acutalibacteraceae bacterium]
MIYEIKDKDIFVYKVNDLNYVAHAHREIEIFICTKGEADATCNFLSKTLKKGNVMMAFPNEIHSYSARHGGEGIIIIINTESLGNLADFKKNKFENFLLEKNENFINLANDLYIEYKNGKNVQIMLGYIHIIIGEILRKLPVISNSFYIHDSLMDNVLNYVLENYLNSITLKSISKKFGISPEHLSRLFSKNISLNFKRYLHFLRIEHSKNLLLNSENSIMLISQMSGYNDLRTFNRVFKQIMGITPSQFRKQKSKNNESMDILS